MNTRRLAAIISVVSIAAVLVASLPMTPARADHCHPEHAKTAATPPTPMTRPARTRAANVGRQRTEARIPNAHNTPARTGDSSLQNGTVGSQTLSFEEIYSRDFPMAIVSLGEAIKAMQSGDRQTELAELSKAVEKLLTVYKALGTRVRPQFANSLSCPITGSPIGINMIDESLTRDYKGRKVAFCCAGCPSAWDKLSDPQKQAKVPGVKF
ncbi:MAG: hypothetical protein ACYSWQ_05010 [Planctomycetota bacterium]|jgi:hypothetical protein